MTWLAGLASKVWHLAQASNILDGAGEDLVLGFLELASPSSRYV